MSTPRTADRRTVIPYGRQSISAADIEAVVAVLRSDFLTQGPAVPRFEEALAARFGAGSAVAMNSATSALHLACLALGVGPGDLVWTSPITFVASANCALYCGASVDFVDIDPETFNMCPDRLEEKLARAEAAGRLPKVVIPVHFGGQPCDMERITALATRYGVAVIEDASHALGALYRDDPVGCGRNSAVTIFSFHPVKIITTGEGGAALTNDPQLAQAMALLRSHGITRDAALMREEVLGPWYYEQLALGYNYRMTDIAAALGSSQLERLNALAERRRALVERYDAAFAGSAVRPQQRDPRDQSSNHLYVVRIDCGHSGLGALHERLRAAGIGVNLHYIPVYLQPFYAELGFAPGLCPAAEHYYREAITLPLFPGLSEVDQDRVIAEVLDAAAAEQQG